MKKKYKKTDIINHVVELNICRMCGEESPRCNCCGFEIDGLNKLRVEENHFCDKKGNHVCGGCFKKFKENIPDLLKDGLEDIEFPDISLKELEARSIKK